MIIYCYICYLATAIDLVCNMDWYIKDAKRDLAPDGFEIRFTLGMIIYFALSPIILPLRLVVKLFKET